MTRRFTRRVKRGGSSTGYTNRRSTLSNTLESYQQMQDKIAREIRELESEVSAFRKQKEVAAKEARALMGNRENRPAMQQIDDDIEITEKKLKWKEGALKIYENLVRSVREEIAVMNSRSRNTNRRRRSTTRGGS